MYANELGIVQMYNEKWEERVEETGKIPLEEAHPESDIEQDHTTIQPWKRVACGEEDSGEK